MNKGKFASLILLGAFSAGVASSSAVSAHGDGNLASTVYISIGSHDDSVTIDSKVSNESMVDADETNIDAETTTDEETQDDSKDEDNNASADTEISDKDIEDKADLLEDSTNQNSKNEDNLSVDNDKNQNVKRVNGVGIVKGLTIAGVSAAALKCTEFSIDKLKGKKDDGNSVDGYVDDNLLNKKIEKLEEELNLAKQDIKAIDDKLYNLLNKKIEKLEEELNLAKQKNIKAFQDTILPNNRAWLWGFMSYAYEKLGYFGEGNKDPNAVLTIHRKGWIIFFCILNLIITLALIKKACQLRELLSDKFFNSYINKKNQVFINILLLINTVSAILCPPAGLLLYSLEQKIITKYSESFSNNLE